MQTLRAASLRHLWRHPAQLALALLGLALGVATITAVDIATASSGRAFELSMQAANGVATHQVVGGPRGIDERTYVRLVTAPWPREAGPRPDFAPVVEGYVSVGGRTLQLLGFDALAEGPFRRPGAASGAMRGEGIEWARRWLTEPGAVVMAERTAAELGIAEDAAFDVGVAGRIEKAQLVGRIGGAQAGLETLLTTDIAQAQEWLDLPGTLSRIDVRVPDGPAFAAAVRTVREWLPPGVELREARGRAQQSLDMSGAFTTNLQAMSLLALLVGAFLIYGAISFAVVQRRRIIGILRALGATRGQVIGLVLTEAAALGAIGAVAGIGLGIVIGRELVALVSRTINDMYFVVAVNEVALPAGTIAKAVGAGFLAALAAAALPAIEVANSPPQLGLRRSVLEGRARSLARGLVLASAGLAAAAALVVTFSGRSLLAGFVALFLLLVAIAAATPALLRLLARLAAHLAAGRSAIARLAFADVAGSLSRTGVAVAALGMAVAAMIGVSIMVESFRQSLRDWLAQTLNADVYVTAPGPGFGRPERRIEPALAAALATLPGVSAHGLSRRVVVQTAGGEIGLDAVELPPGGERGFTLSQGEPAAAWRAFREGALIVSEPLAWRSRLRAGDSLTLVTAAGPRAFRVAGVYREYGNDRGSALIDRAVYRALWRDDDVTSIGLYAAPGVAADALVARVHAAAAGRQQVYVRANADIRELSMTIFERTFVITRVLYWLAAGVAAIGLVSALLAWELERSRELAILRTLGLTPRGAGVLIEVQTAFLGLAALVAAAPAGVLTAVVLIEVINRRAFGWQIDLHVTPAQFADAAALALAAALAAGLYPAWRTARAPLAREIREE